MEVLRNHQLDFMLVVIGACTIIAILTFLSNAIPKKRRRLLIFLEFSVIFLLLADREALIFRGDTTTLGYYMVRITNFVCFMLVITALFCFNRYLQNLYSTNGLENIPKRLRVSDYLCIIGWTLIIVSQFTGLYYTFDETNHYRRASGYIISYICPTLILILQLSVILQYKKLLKKSVWISLLLFSCIPLIASFVQSIIYGISLTNIMMTGLVIVVYVIDLREMNSEIETSHRLLEEKQEENLAFIDEMIQSFSKIIDMRDHYTNGHSLRVANYTVMLTRELGYDEETVQKFKNIALLHDIGKIGISESLLNKAGQLTKEEYRIIQSHSQLGYEALKDICIMPDLAIGAGAHHERPDGRGYPNHLKDKEIPNVARIISVADSFDAMYSDRPYRKRMNFDKVVSIIRENSGKQFDEEVVNAFLRLVDQGEFREADDDGNGSLQEIDNLWE